MANYPNSVTTFTTKVDGAGNKVQAAHINDIQNEVTAIEDGLLNGTAPVNSSRITAPASQITNSTVTSLTATNLQVTNSTFTNRPVFGPPDLVKVNLASPQNLTSGSTQALAWTAQEIAITAGMHSTGTNPSRLTPLSTGVYGFSVNVSLSGNAAASTSRLSVVVEDSSGTILAQTGKHNQGAALSGNQEENALFVSGAKRFDAIGGWIRAVAFFSDSSTNSLSTRSWMLLEKK